MKIETKETSTFEFFRKNSLIAVIFSFLLFFIYGCLTFDDYGIAVDEATQRYHSLVVYNDLFLNGKEYQTNTVDTTTLPSLDEYGTNYGVILQLPLIFIEHLTGFQMTWSQIFSMRHLYNFIWFFVSAIFFYKIAMILTKSQRYESLLGTLIYVLCPRILADSFYNIKDLLCLSLFTISIYYCIRLIRKISLRDLLLFVIFSALCTTSRIVGGVVVAVCLVVLFLKSIHEKNIWKYLRYFAIIGLLFVGIFIIVNPNVWSDIPGTILRIIQTFSNYTTWDDVVFYMGEWISGSQLPWHYLFVWILITVPSCYILFMCYGIGRGTCSLITGGVKHKSMTETSWVYLAMLLIVIIPFAYFIIVRPVLYNGWRHFYFMYSMIACWAVIGIHYTIHSSRKLIKYGSLICLGISLTATGVWTLNNHPYEYVYFTPWARGFAENYFELDYWDVTEIDALQYIYDTYNQNHTEIKVVTPYSKSWYFDTEETNPFVETNHWYEADYVIPLKSDFIGSYLFDRDMEINVDGMNIRSVYKRNYNIMKDYSLSIKDEDVRYSVDDIQWTDQSTKEEHIYLGHLTEKMPADVVAVTVSDEELITTSGFNLLVSEDGENWYSLYDTLDFSQYDTQMYSTSPVENLNYIKIIFSSNYKNDCMIDIIIAGGKHESYTSEYHGNNAIITLETNSEKNENIYNMIDGCNYTRWTTEHQNEGMYLIVTLDDVYEISAAELELYESTWDYPRNLQIYASMDGDQWEQLDVSTEDDELFLFNETECKYIRFELGYWPEEILSNWSIYELKLYSEIN